MEESTKHENPLDLNSVLNSLPNITIESGGQFVVNINTSGGGEIKSATITNNEDLKSKESGGILAKFLKYWWVMVAFPVLGYFIETGIYKNYHSRYLILNTYLRAEKLFVEFEKKLDFELVNGTFYVACHNYIDRLDTIFVVLSENAKVLREYGTPNQIDVIQSLENKIKFIKENLKENLERIDLKNPVKVKEFKRIINVQNKNLLSLFNNTQFMLFSEYQECRVQKKISFYSCINLKDIKEEKFPYFLF